MSTLCRLNDAPDLSWATRLWCTGAPRQPFSLRSLVMPPASDRALCSGERVKRGGLGWLVAGRMARGGPGGARRPRRPYRGLGFVVMLGAGAVAR